jgi:hypothetical protein
MGLMRRGLYAGEKSSDWDLFAAANTDEHYLRLLRF